MVLFFVGVAFSGLFSWFFTHVYYKKSLKQQEDAAESQIEKLTDALAVQNETDAALLMQKRIEESIAEYKRTGTPVRVIDTYTDLSNDKKAEILDTVFLRAKGRRAKQNKYRSL
jgi:hypothetical protein